MGDLLPDSATLLSLGFDGQVALSDAGDAVPFARLDSGKPSIPATAMFYGDGRTVLLAYQDGGVLAFDTRPDCVGLPMRALWPGATSPRPSRRDALGDLA